MRQYIDLFSKPQVLSELSTPRTTFDAVLHDDTIRVGFEFEVVLKDAHDPEKYINPFDLSDSDDPYADLLEYFDVTSRQLERFVRDWFVDRVRAGWESTKDEVMAEQARDNGYDSAAEFEEDDHDGYWNAYRSEEESYAEGQWDDFDAEEMFDEYLQSEYDGQLVSFANDKDISLSNNFGWIDDTHIGEENELDFDDRDHEYDVILQNFSEELQEYIGEEVEIGDRDIKDPTRWYIEPDSSIKYSYNDKEAPCEIVTKVYSLGHGVKILNDMLEWIDNGHMTNDSTGLHANLSIEGKGAEDYDVLKMMLFYDENYVAKQFGRVKNRYAKMTRNQISRILSLVGQEDASQAKTQQARDALSALDTITKNAGNTRAIDEFIRIMRQMFSVLDNSMEQKYRSLNPRHNGVFEFRSMGGSNYHKKGEEIRRNLVNFAYILKIGSDPTFKRQEYVKKLVSLMHGKFDAVDVDHLNAGSVIQKHLAMVPSWSGLMMKDNKLERAFKNLIVAHTGGNKSRTFSYNLLDQIVKEHKVISKKMLKELVSLYTALNAVNPQNLEDFLTNYFVEQGVKIV